MTLVPSFLELVHPWSWAMTTPSFANFLTVLTGWVFAPRRTITGILVAAGVVIDASVVARIILRIQE